MRKRRILLAAFVLALLVWEWCEDAWHDFYADAPTDGSPWVAKGSQHRVIRGGGSDAPAMWCQAAYRVRNRTAFHEGFLGFRPTFSTPEE